MTTNELRLAEANVAYIGKGVTIKGEINAPDVIVVDGTIEGDVTARSIRVGTTGVIKGNVTSEDADVHGSLSEKVEVREFLLVRSTGRIEGNVSCGDVQVEKGAVLAGGVFSIHAKAPKPAEKPTNEKTAKQADRPESKAEQQQVEHSGLKLAAAE
jgi:cytoskeletal protein CcmA (bactofilin family)